MSELVYPRESYAIMAACFNVYNEMGSGFLEPVYQECLQLELESMGIPFVPQCELRIRYRGRELRQTFRLDFLVYGCIILELKAVNKLASEHRAQTLNYLNASGHKLALLLNFGHYPKLESERIVLTH